MEATHFTITRQAVYEMSNAEMEAALERISPEVREKLRQHVDARVDILTRAFMTPMPEPAPPVFHYVPPRRPYWGGRPFINPDWSSLPLG